MKLVASNENIPPSGSGEYPPSVVKILDGAIHAIVSRGARRLSMSDILEESGVSRGTLYRYFSSKDEVLTAVSEYVCRNFEDGIRSAGSEFHDPIQKFVAIMQFYAQFTHERTPERIFDVEPAFHLEFFRSHFDRHKAAVADAMSPVFDHIEERLGGHLNRDPIVETLLRTQLSTLLVPASPGWMQTWLQIPGQVQAWLETFIHQPKQN